MRVHQDGCLGVWSRRRTGRVGDETTVSVITYDLCVGGGRERGRKGGSERGREGEREGGKRGRRKKIELNCKCSQLHCICMCMHIYTHVNMQLIIMYRLRKESSLDSRSVC